MRTLIYKRTHEGDPDSKTGTFGIYGCMGRVRAWDFEAVIGVGGTSARPKWLVRRINWVGIGARKGRRHADGWPLVTFDHFVQYSLQGAAAPEFGCVAPHLAERLYSTNVRLLIRDLDPIEQAEVRRILARARRDADQGQHEPGQCGSPPSRRSCGSESGRNKRRLTSARSRCDAEPSRLKRRR